jgi:hypothetical protein
MHGLRFQTLLQTLRTKKLAIFLFQAHRNWRNSAGIRAIRRKAMVCGGRRGIARMHIGTTSHCKIRGSARLHAGAQHRMHLILELRGVQLLK